MSSTYSGATGPVPAASPGYGESRSSWPGPPVTGQHGPGSPGPPTSSTPASQSSPQPPSHSPGPGLPPSPQHQPSQHQVIDDGEVFIFVSYVAFLAEFSKQAGTADDAERSRPRRSSELNFSLVIDGDIFSIGHGRVGTIKGNGPIMWR